MYGVLFVFVSWELRVLTSNVNVESDNSELLRAFGSWDAARGMFPFMVSIMKRGVNDSHCGGSILTNTAILTGCNCIVFDSKNGTPNYDHFFVIAGVVDLREMSNGQVRSVSTFIRHPRCNVKSIPIETDIGFVFVQQPFVFDSKVEPVKLVSVNGATLKWWHWNLVGTNKPCHIPGWSTVRVTEYEKNPRLQDDMVRLISDKKCQKMICYRYQQCMNSTEMRHCAISYDSQFSCEGEPGGPLVCNGYLFGVVSSGPLTCKPYANDSQKLFPLIYTDPIVILNFIKLIIPKYKYTTTFDRNDLRTKVRPLKYPFVVSIANISNKYAPVSFCSGSILTHSSFVTTCTCLNGLRLSKKKPNDAVAISGNLDLFEDSLAYSLPIIRIVTHKKCYSKDEANLHNVGVGFVLGSFGFFSRHVQPLTFPSINIFALQESIDSLIARNTHCYISTWGYSVQHPKQIKYHVFVEWETHLHNLTKCQRRFCKDRFPECLDAFVFNRELCGEAYDESQPCWGDVGGPFVCGRHFLGFVSYNGDLCSFKNKVKITSAITILDFISTVIPEYFDPIEERMLACAVAILRVGNINCLNCALMASMVLYLTAWISK